MASQVSSSFVDLGKLWLAPLHDIHHIVGGLVKKAIDEGVRLEALPFETLKDACDAFDEDVKDVLTPSASTAARAVPGGTSKTSVEAQISQGRGLLETRGTG